MTWSHARWPASTLSTPPSRACCASASSATAASSCSMSTPTTTGARARSGRRPRRQPRDQRRHRHRRSRPLGPPGRSLLRRPARRRARWPSARRARERQVPGRRDVGVGAPDLPDHRLCAGSRVQEDVHGRVERPGRRRAASRRSAARWRPPCPAWSSRCAHDLLSAPDLLASPPGSQRVWSTWCGRGWPPASRCGGPCPAAAGSTSTGRCRSCACTGCRPTVRPGDRRAGAHPGLVPDRPRRRRPARRARRLGRRRGRGPRRRLRRLPRCSSCGRAPILARASRRASASARPRADRLATTIDGAGRGTARMTLPATELGVDVVATGDASPPGLPRLIPPAAAQRAGCL